MVVVGFLMLTIMGSCNKKFFEKEEVRERPPMKKLSGKGLVINYDTIKSYTDPSFKTYTYYYKIEVNEIKDGIRNNEYLYAINGIRKIIDHDNLNDIHMFVYEGHLYEGNYPIKWASSGIKLGIRCSRTDGCQPTLMNWPNSPSVPTKDRIKKQFIGVTYLYFKYNLDEPEYALTGCKFVLKKD